MDFIKEKLSYTKSSLDSVFGRIYTPTDLQPVDLYHKRAIVSGANAGLGKAIAISLVAQGAEVHLLCRNYIKANAARDEIIKQTGHTKIFTHTVDFSSLSSVAEFVASWQKRGESEKRLDILVNNAGLIAGSKVTSPDGFELTYAVNVLGQFALTIPLLQHGCFSSDARIVQVSSATMYQGYQPPSHPANLNSADMLERIQDGGEVPVSQVGQLYGRSKALQVIFTMELQERLRGDPRYPNVVVQSCHPGIVNTAIWTNTEGLGFNPSYRGWISFIGTGFGISPEEGAKTPVWLATAPEFSDPAVRGRYWERKTWKWVPAWMLDKDRRRVIWDAMARDAKMEGVY